MSLATLVLQLRPLLDDVRGNWDAVTRLLDQYQDLAEYEVARHIVAKRATDWAIEQARSEDPLERLQAARMVRLTFSRAGAGQILRRLVKDPNLRVRSHARFAALQLGIDDVALPDRKAALADDFFGGGEWNRHGWLHGGLVRWGGAPPLAPDVEALGLANLPTCDALAQHFGLKSDADLVRFTRPGSGTGAPYVDFDIPKRTGGTRRISAPRPALRALQRTILMTILDSIPVHDAAHGFVRGRSTVTNARPHTNAAVVVKLDIEDFFPSIHYRRVLGLFQHYGYTEEVAARLAALCTRRPILPDGRVAWPGVLPQGAPTSPAIANLVCRRLDARLTGLAAKVGATYTRYADDLTFSFRAEPERLGRFFWWVDQVVQQEGFAEKPPKRRVFRAGGRQAVTGIVVNHGLSVPRAARRRFRAILHNCRKNGVAAEARGRADFRDYLRGFAAYVHMVQPELGRALMDEVQAVLRGEPAPVTTAGSSPTAPAAPTRPGMMAIISKALFKQDCKLDGQEATTGQVVPLTRYTSKNKNLQRLADDGADLYLFTVRPPDEQLWLVAVLETPTFTGEAWTAATNLVPIVDISDLRDQITFESGKGISAKPGALGMSLQTPRALSAADVALLRQRLSAP